MKISEIFLSIDGEGIRTGYPVIFIRSYSCNLKCSYCDSLYAIAGDEYTEMSVVEILDEIHTKWDWCKKVTVTGGEPLLQLDCIDLIKNLLMQGYEVNIETNGAVSLEPLFEDNVIRSYRRDVIITMDWKSISSNMSELMLKDNLRFLKRHDVLKFVVGSIEDLDQMKSIITENDLTCSIFVSPIFGNIEPVQIVEYILENKLSQVRCQIQIHKIIWKPEKRGV